MKDGKIFGYRLFRSKNIPNMEVQRQVLISPSQRRNRPDYCFHTSLLQQSSSELAKGVTGVSAIISKRSPSNSHSIILTPALHDA